jgi:hypothetical protein
MVEIERLRAEWEDALTDFGRGGSLERIEAAIRALIEWGAEQAYNFREADDRDDAYRAAHGEQMQYHDRKSKIIAAEALPEEER